VAIDVAHLEVLVVPASFNLTARFGH
jgi:hypothetical protein